MPVAIQKPDMMTVHPCAKLAGTLTAPGDKSVSHRVAMLASLAKGISRVHGFLNSEDCLGTLKAMEALGATSRISRDGELFIHGTGGRVIDPAGALDLGNSGTSMRLMAGLLSGFDTPIELIGDGSLSQRPMRRVAEPLRQMGASIELTEPKGTAPMRLRGGKLKAIEYQMPVASAQVKSCIMLAALSAEGTTTVTEPAPTRDHTEYVFKRLGLPMRIDGLTIQIDGQPGGLHLPALEWHIPGDISSAAFWLVAAAAHKRGSVTLHNVGLNPRRTAILDVLKRMGARIKVVPKKGPEGSEPVGEIRITGSKLKGTVIGGDEIPNLIDEIPILAVAGALAEGETVIKDAAELRVKESDRISVMCENLQAMGVEVEEMADGMRVVGPARLSPSVALNSHGDHRIAMSMAVLALFGPSPVMIKGVQCIETSYPGFRDHLKLLGGHVE
jgi:3-phosphoshikimate 1-carboxyvinyltransferase